MSGPRTLPALEQVRLARGTGPLQPIRRTIEFDHDQCFNCGDFKPTSRAGLCADCERREVAP